MRSVRWKPHPGVRLHNEQVAPGDAERQERTVAEILRRFAGQPGVVLADDVGLGKTFVALATAAGVLESTGYRRPVLVMVPSSLREKWPTDFRTFAERCVGGGRVPRATEHTLTSAGELLKLLDDPPDRRRHLIFATHRVFTNQLPDPYLHLAIVRQAFLRTRTLRAQRRAFPRWARTLLGWRNTDGDVDLLLRTPPDRWRWHAGHDDDPVPAALRRVLPDLHLEPVRAVLRTMPLRDSAGIDRRLAAVRSELRSALQGVWQQALREMRFSAPLLILDEAHHTRNPTRLSSLFEDPAETESVIGGVLHERFDRMLFLTATPFQLGHHELIRVLGHFGAARMRETDRAALRMELGGLAAQLDECRARALDLQREWPTRDAGDRSAGWWRQPPTELSPEVGRVARYAQAAVDAWAKAEAGLRKWVIRHRHNRDRHERPESLPIPPDAMLPFLLANRVEALIGELGIRNQEPAVHFFFTGLCSSWEAYCETRTHPGQNPGVDERPAPSLGVEVRRELRWYLDKIGSEVCGGRSAHPKVAATAQRVLDLWVRKEKVVVFCHYRKTGDALSQAIGTRLRDWSTRQIEDAGIDRADLARWGRASRGGRVERLVTAHWRSLGQQCSLEVADVESLARVTLRFLRTEAFQVRYLNLRTAASRGLDVAMEQAFHTALGEHLRRFAAFMAARTPEERAAIVKALSQIRTGSRGGFPFSASVRVVNGDTPAAERQRWMRAFNTPFLPEVLVTSQVLGEGVDLQHECRHVIHHDLHWNPTVVEQRNGRIDRIGSKARRVGEPVEVYVPYLADTADERLYRVMMDRRQWFDIVLGGKGEAPISAAEEEVAVPPRSLPEDLVEALVPDLTVRPTRSSGG